MEREPGPLRSRSTNPTRRESLQRFPQVGDIDKRLRFGVSPHVAQCQGRDDLPTWERRVDHGLPGAPNDEPCPPDVGVPGDIGNAARVVGESGLDRPLLPLDGDVLPAAAGGRTAREKSEGTEHRRPANDHAVRLAHEARMAHPASAPQSIAQALAGSTACGAGGGRCRSAGCGCRTRVPRPGGGRAAAPVGARAAGAAGAAGRRVALGFLFLY